MVTTGVTKAFTFMVTAFEVAVAGLGQTALLVKMQVTTSLSAKVLLLYVVVPAPTLVPFNFHW